MTERQARDEGAKQTQIIVDAVRRLRTAKGWSAAQLAEEMTKAGVPWNADVIVNLEHGRRKSLRVHELLALLFVLDAPQPLEVIVPGEELYPVVPGLLHDASDVRAWLRGEGIPLRQKMAAGTIPPEAMESVARLYEQLGRPEMAADVRRTAALLAKGDDDGQD